MCSNYPELGLVHVQYKIIVIGNFSVNWIANEIICIVLFYFPVENKCIFKYINGNSGSVKAISPTLYIYNPYAEVIGIICLHWM